MQRIMEIEANANKECEARLKEDAALHEKMNNSFNKLLYWMMGSMATTIITLVTVLLKKGV